MGETRQEPWPIPTAYMYYVAVSVYVILLIIDTRIVH